MIQIAEYNPEEERRRKRREFKKGKLSRASLFSPAG
jgi:hypothetical protein